MNKTYVIIDEVYPFSDLNMLCSMAEGFYNSGIPFIIYAMPIYENFEYPAFKRYAQVLRYIQSKGGSIILHETENEKLESTKQAFETENIMLFDYRQNTNNIVYKLPKTQEDIDNMIKKLNEKWIVINDYKAEFTNMDFFYNETPYDENYIYNQQIETSFQNFFAITDIFLISVVSIGIVAFIILIVIGNHLYKKKFYK